MTAGQDGAKTARIRLGMVGGGQGSFIGAVHRMAARIDDHFDLVAGAFSSAPARAALSAAEIGVDATRSYADFHVMAKTEAARPDGIEAVSIVTPNHLHAPAVMAFLKAGIHVICEKPLGVSLDEANALVDAVAASGRLFVLTHNYTGYPMVRQARDMVRNGLLGDLRIVQAEYAQDWLTEAIESEGQKQAGWRTDPAQSGGAGALGDIGTHAFNLLSFVSGLIPREVCAELTHFVPGRRVDDDAQILMRFEGGAKGMIWASQVAPGHANGLRLRLYGSRGGLEWAQEEPNTLWHTPYGEPKRVLTRAGAGLSDAATRVARLPAGHPEGYLEAFGTIYSAAAQAINAFKAGLPPAADSVFPTILDGRDGMRFIAASLMSSRNGGTWTQI